MLKKLGIFWMLMVAVSAACGRSAEALTVSGGGAPKGESIPTGGGVS